MKKTNLVTYLVASTLFMGASSALAAIDPVAETVLVSKTCTENSSPLDNCFTNMASLTNWMSDIRKPNINNPLHVDIGSGTFSETVDIVCDASSGYTGHTTFQGRGTSQSIIEGRVLGVNVSNCTELNFDALQITTTMYGGVKWNGGGNSRWNNIEVNGLGRVWYEEQCAAARGSHYWFSSKLNTTAEFSSAESYRATCDESWFFGSEISTFVPEGAIPSEGAAVLASDDGIIHVYGSVLRALIDGPINANAVVTAAAVGPLYTSDSRVGGEIHIHGTGIDVISKTGRDAVVFSAGPNGMIHADVSAYNISTTGNKTRIKNNGGVVKAPYQWSQNNQPPQVVSENGADMFVETNCDEDACHDVDTGLQTHLLIYNENCNFAGHGPWFDVVTRKCRGEMSTN